MSFSPPDQNLFFSKSDIFDVRMGDLVEPISLADFDSHKESHIIAGYPDDEGISLNGGRPGAEAGPDSIRHFLYRMTPSLNRQPMVFYDIGNLHLKTPLKERHGQAKQAVCQALQKKFKWIGLGGGHDYRFSDGGGFLEAQAKGALKPLIINFDAHLDVRPTSKGLTSGTPFYRLIENYKNFDLLQIGIQTQCNSKQHYQWAIDHGVKILSFEEILKSKKSQSTKILEFLKPFLKKSRPTYVSLDIDGFSSSVAPGCSQSWPTGFEVSAMMNVLDELKNKLEVQCFGIYEVSPPLDLGSQTSKLAALLIHRFLQT